MDTIMNTPVYARFLFAVSLTLFLISGCSSGPEVKSVSKAPGVSEAPQNLLVLAISSKEHSREIMEAALVSRLEHAGYNAEQYGPAPSLPWDDPPALREKVKERLQTLDADGVLTVSLVQKSRQVEHIPNQVVFNPVTTSMGTLASITYMETMTIPAHYQESTEYILRTTLFETESGQAIWQMFSRTVDPESLEQATREFSRVVVRELRQSFKK